MLRIMSRTRAAVSLGVLPTRTPAFSRASFLAWAVPEEPEMIAPAWPIVLSSRGGDPAHVADARLGHVLLDEPPGPFLGVAADLADHHDGVGLRVLLERLQAVDVRRPDHRVAADADRGGEADVAQLVHHLVGQRAGLGDQPDPPLAGDVGRDDSAS